MPYMASREPKCGPRRGDGMFVGPPGRRPSAASSEVCKRSATLAPRGLFVDDALDFRGADNAVRRLVIAGVVPRLLAVPFHFLIAIVGFPDAFGFVFVFAGNRHHCQVVVFVIRPRWTSVEMLSKADTACILARMCSKTRIRLITCAALAALFLVLPITTRGQSNGAWVTSWAASVQGPYPVGNPSAQPDQSSRFPAPEAGARDQTFRLIVRPDIWGRAGAAALLQRVRHQAGDVRRRLRRRCSMSGAAIVQGTNRPVTFGGKPSVTVAPGSIGVERRGRAAVRARPGRDCSPGASSRSASTSPARAAR